MGVDKAFRLFQQYCKTYNDLLAGVYFGLSAEISKFSTFDTILDGDNRCLILLKREI